MKEVYNTGSYHEKKIQLTEAYHGLHHISLRIYSSMKVFSSNLMFWSHNISSKGSVVAEFQLMFRSKVSSDEASADLKNQISDGNLGNLPVDPTSLEQIYPTTQGIFPFLAILSIKAKQLTLSARLIWLIWRADLAVERRYGHKRNKL